MNELIKQRIEQIRCGKVPVGYKRTKDYIVPLEWTAFQFGALYTERKESGNNNLPILTVSIHSGVSDGALDEKEIGKKVRRIEDKSQYKRAISGDLVFNMMRAWQGAIGVVCTDGMVSPAYIVAAPNSKIYPLFMDYYMKTPHMINTIHRQSYGVMDFRLRLYWDSFARINCCIPCVTEQKKIAQILSTCDKIIELKEKRVAEKKQQKKYLMQQLLTGRKRSKGFEGEWEKCRLHQIVTRINQRNDSGNTNVLTISAQFGLISQENFFNKQIASENKDAYYYLEHGDFAYNKSYSSGYPYGAIKRLKYYENGIVSPLYICFRIVSENVSDKYLEQYFEAGLMNREIQAYAQEGARNHGLLNIPITDFFNSKLCLPDLQEQKRIIAILSTADYEIELLQRDLEQEKLKKKALMQLLLTGIVRVNT